MKPQPSSIEPTSLAARLARFREAHPWRRVELDGVEWRYRAVGEGENGLVLLPGSAGGGDAYFLLVERLTKRFRCVLIDYPVVAGIESLLAGIEAILHREEIARLSIVGGSFGGLVAQALLLTMPQRVSRVVLNSTGPPSPARARSNRRWQPVLRLVPMLCIRTLLRLVVRKIVARVEIEPDFWRDYYIQAASAVSRSDLESKYRVSIEFDEQLGDRLTSLAGWDGEILVTEGSADSVATARTRQELLRAYPRARVKTFAGAGHGVSLERPDDWRRMVADFLLDRQDPGAAS